MKLPWRR